MEHISQQTRPWLDRALVFLWFSLDHRARGPPGVIRARIIAPGLGHAFKYGQHRTAQGRGRKSQRGQVGWDGHKGAAVGAVVVWGRQWQQRVGPVLMVGQVHSARVGIERGRLGPFATVHPPWVSPRRVIAGMSAGLVPRHVRMSPRMDAGRAGRVTVLAVAFSERRAGRRGRLPVQGIVVFVPVVWPLFSVIVIVVVVIGAVARLLIARRFVGLERVFAAVELVLKSETQIWGLRTWSLSLRFSGNFFTRLKIDTPASTGIFTFLGKNMRTIFSFSAKLDLEDSHFYFIGNTYPRTCH